MMVNRNRIRWPLPIMLIGALVLSGCFPESPEQKDARATVVALSTEMAEVQAEVFPQAAQPVDYPEADVVYTLTTAADGTSLVFVGVGGEIDGVVNPTLTADPGQVVQIRVVNGMPVEHDLRIDEFDVETGSLTAQGQEAAVTFMAHESGIYKYYCSIPGHRAAGMEGTLQVGDAEAAGATGENVVRHPADLPGPIGDRGPELVQVELTAQEVVGQLADGTTFTYFTYNGAIPGPFIRARVGDTVGKVPLK
jgi:nitrite reductase (NO-forming)